MLRKPVGGVDLGSNKFESLLELLELFMSVIIGLKVRARKEINDAKYEVLLEHF